MAEQTIIKADLAESIYREVGLSRVESTNIVSSIFDAITTRLIRGDEVKIASFASFALLTKAPRVGRNPKTGQEATIAKRRVVSFKPSDILRKHVNKR